MPEASPSVSVIVPVYNTEQHLADCLDSIVGQTHRELEILLIDDGSTDSSREICQRYADQDDRIRLVVQENAGVSAARNAGLAHASGTYVHFVDADDWLEPTLYSDVVSKMLPTAEDVAIFEYYVDHADRSVRHHDPKSTYGPLKPEAALELTIASQNGFAFSRVFRRVCIGDLTFRGDLHWGEETLFVCEVLERCKRIIHLDHALYHYRQSAGSATRSGFGPRRLSGIDTARALIDLTSARHPDLVPHAYAFYGDILTQLLVEIWPDREARALHAREVRSQLRAVMRKSLMSPSTPSRSKTRWMVASFSPSAMMAMRDVRHGRWSRRHTIAGPSHQSESKS